MVKRRKEPEPWQLKDAERLKKIFDSRDPKISQMKFGEEFGIGTQGMVWQYLTGVTPLNIDAAANFARGLGVSIDAFSESLAARVEDAYKLTSKGSVRESEISRVFSQLSRAQQDAVMTIIASYGITPRASAAQSNAVSNENTKDSKQRSSFG